MIPIRDTVESRNYPVVNHLIIAVNVGVYFIQLAQGAKIDHFVFLYGLVPARYSDPFLAHYFTPGQQLFSFLSFMFVHGDIWHILFNMWSLHIFGDNVEDRLGPVRYVFFYLLCGWVSGLSHLVVNWHSQVPTVGASGAIAGVMGAYFILYPGARILTMIPILIFPFFVELPAFFFLGLWFFFQLVSAAGAPVREGGVAWWAHIGGFVFGILCLKLFIRVPETGITRAVRSRTARKKTPHLQAIHATGLSGDPNLYGEIVITSEEASGGARKLINMPWAFQKRLLRVTVPPGVREGTILRLEGMGREMPGTGRGDLLLKVHIQDRSRPLVC
ncbi:MAG: rhomboid family intramembrane serine protease [Desulfococcus sp. 4484_242]|nr:MAG: rhomboid family intramembrane serine protease [Desulfococcus sp. 4484_242]